VLLDNTPPTEMSVSHVHLFVQSNLICIKTFAAVSKLSFEDLLQQNQLQVENILSFHQDDENICASGSFEVIQLKGLSDFLLF
jgi:hypothetical protein